MILFMNHIKWHVTSHTPHSIHLTKIGEKFATDFSQTAKGLASSPVKQVCKTVPLYACKTMQNKAIFTSKFITKLIIQLKIDS